MSEYLDMCIRLVNLRGNDSLSLVTISQVTDPANPLDVTNTWTPDPIISYKGRFKRSEVDGEIIRKSDIKLYVDPSTLSTIPKINDKITDGNITYNIQKVTTYLDVDTVVLYILQIRE
jgi:hypothetical protein